MREERASNKEGAMSKVKWTTGPYTASLKGRPGHTGTVPGKLSSKDALAIVMHRNYGDPLPEHLHDYYEQKYGKDDK